VLIVGLLIGFVILLISDHTRAGTAFVTILTHGFSSMRVMGDVLLGATPIIFTGLSVAFAFRTGLFNIGATGQFTLGALAAVYIAIEATFLPPALRILVAVIAAMMVGALWGAIPGLLKAFRNVHEVITCIMTNYVAMYLATQLVHSYLFNPLSGRSHPPPMDVRLPTVGLENIFVNGRPSGVDIGIILAIFTAILIYIILQKTTFGYELKACGFNSDAAQYAGINQKRNIVASMMICGALSGFGGALAYLGGLGLTLDIVHVLLQDGFVGISVAFLGMNHPIGIIFSGTLISFLTTGGTRIQTTAEFPMEFVNIVIAIIIYFCAFVLLVNTMFGNVIDKVFKKKNKGEQELEMNSEFGIQNSELDKDLESEPEASLDLKKKVKVSIKRKEVDENSEGGGQ
jgi:simple sugar transport system permease protein